MAGRTRLGTADRMALACTCYLAARCPGIDVPAPLANQSWRLQPVRGSCDPWRRAFRP